ncbi:MAG: lysophospholipid acyltransferase family protein [Acidobacteriota bacterium]|nr:lysophospholipid acyltransferase family protein [Acidobacteriota bacterium]
MRLLVDPLLLHKFAPLNPGRVAALFRKLISILRSLAAYVSVSLWVLLLAPVGMILALVFRSPGVLYWLGRGGVRLGLATAGIRVQVDGYECVQKSRGAVYCANHSSNLEPPIIYMALAAIHPRLKILYKSELRAAIPILRSAFDMAGFVPIERRNTEQSSLAIERAALALTNGDSFMIFPEGTRSRTGALLPFKAGGFLMAIKGQAPIVPVAISGARTAMEKGSPVINPVTVTVKIGQPIETDGFEVAERNSLIRETRSALEALLGMVVTGHPQKTTASTVITENHRLQ